MALFAGLGEIRRHVIRVGRSLVISQVTADARGGSQVVVVVDMTIGALPWRHRVHPG